MTTSDHVRDVMTKGLVTVSPDVTLLDAQKLFGAHRFHHLPVLEGDVLVGVLSDRDILRSLSPFLDTLAERTQDLDTMRRRVHSVMSRKLVVIDAEADVAMAAQTMLASRVSCLPVLSQQKLVGIITTRDMLRWVVGQDRGALPPASSRGARQAVRTTPRRRT